MKYYLKLLNLITALLVAGVCFSQILIGQVSAQAATKLATLGLSPASGTLNQGCNYVLDINLDTAGADTDGTDVILLYENAKVVATSIVSGTIYPDYPGNNIDAQAGRITVSGLSSVTTAYKGSGVLAKINITIPNNAPLGPAQIRFDFDPNNKSKTTDSNVVERGSVKDILNSAASGNYTIGTGTCSGVVTQVTPTPTPRLSGGGTIDSTPSAKKPVLDEIVGGKTGVVETTIMLTVVGGVLTVLGILGLALL